MNIDKIDLEALQRDLEEFAREQRSAAGSAGTGGGSSPRCCWR